MAPDPRRVVGALVETKAKFVTADSECKRRFGSLWKTQIVVGTVVVSWEATTVANGKRASISISANWNLGGGKYKTAGVNSRSVSLHTPTLTPVEVTTGTVVQEAQQTTGGDEEAMMATTVLDLESPDATVRTVGEDDTPMAVETVTMEVEEAVETVTMEVEEASATGVPTATTRDKPAISVHQPFMFCVLMGSFVSLFYRFILSLPHAILVHRGIELRGVFKCVCMSPVCGDVDVLPLVIIISLYLYLLYPFYNT